MYITLAARPLPKCFNFLLSILLFNLSCALVYVYIVMRKITSSSERFEIVPCYSVALLLFCSGVCSLVTTRVQFRGRKCLIHSNMGLFLATSVVAMVAMSATMWLADMADSFSICVYNKHSFACLCRYNTTSTVPALYDDWYSYNDIAGCHKLDQLSRCMTASLILNASGAFVCIVGIVNFFMTLRQMARQRNAPDGGAVVVTLTNGQTQTGDWDSWLFSHPSFRETFAEVSRGACPPSYDETVQREQQLGQGGGGGGSIPPLDEPPPPYSNNPLRSNRRVKCYQAPPRMISVNQMSPPQQHS